MARRFNAQAPAFAAQFGAFLNEARGEADDVALVVRSIIADVRARGDAAVVELSNKYDHARISLATLRVSESDLEAAAAKCGKEALAALGVAATRIEAYHRKQIPDDAWFTDDTGAKLGWRWTPLDSVGVYVPGGTAAYPSSVLMNVIPARIAGVERIVMVTPARGGVIDPLVLAAARRAGVTEIYKVGGAQAVAALAFGTMSIAAVHKIVGPGNAYVAAAKREVFGRVGIDSIAGPSEILVLADGENDPQWIAADLLSQAEHDASSQSILITDNPAFADRVATAIENALRVLPRESIARASWETNGAIITVAKLEDAAALVDAVAPEHLEIATSDPDAFLKKVRHAGAIFLGRHTPEAVGDYVAGPNHVLPTSRTARFSSGLSVLDFLKRTTLLQCEPKSLAALGPEAIALAEAEGLDAHARSIAARLNRRDGH